MSLFTNSPLQVEVLDNDNYKLLSELVWQLEYENTEGDIAVVPEDFVTDFDSVPWYIKWAPIIRQVIRSRAKAKKAFVLHDFGFGGGYVYRLQEDGTRKPVAVESLTYWNKVMADAMLVEGSTQFTANVYEWGTGSRFGKQRWDANTESRKQMFADALAKYHADHPSTTAPTV